MRRTARWRLLLALCAATGSCVGSGSRVEPHVAPSVAINGRGALVALEISDRRPAEGSQAEFVPMLQTAISRALWKIGFRPSEDPSTPRRLLVEIRDVDSEPLLAETRRLRVHAALEARAEYGGRAYEQLYRSQAEMLIPSGAGHSFTQEQLDLVVWDALQKMFADEALFAVLARE
jgi:hypothetical protein